MLKLSADNDFNFIILHLFDLEVLREKNTKYSIRKCQVTVKKFQKGRPKLRKTVSS